LNPRIAGSIADEQAVEGTVETDGRAIRFILLLGAVSLFADMAYEGGRSIVGPFLGLLGAGGTVVGVLSGFGELAGYGVRFVSGRVADRSRRYWSIATAGYGLNLLAVPALALAGSWPVAACLVIAERLGKGIRTPARDALLSHASTRAGAGRAFGLHEALDQIGAVAGPLGVSIILAFSANGYRRAFAALVVPAIIALALLRYARRKYPDPTRFESNAAGSHDSRRHPAFVPYLVAASLVAAGFADFPLVALRLQADAVMAPTWIPVFYAVAMGTDAGTAIVLGRWFDRSGIAVLIPATLVSAAFAPLVFGGGPGMALLGILLWGAGVGAHESVMRAAVAGMAAPGQRARAYGLFNGVYGLAWFAGSAVLGVLYDHSRTGMILFSVVAQLAAIPFLIAAVHRRAGDRA